MCSGFPSRQARSVCAEIMRKQQNQSAMAIRPKAIALWGLTDHTLARFHHAHE
jgi:hypothetical protein